MPIAYGPNNSLKQVFLIYLFSKALSKSTKIRAEKLTHGIPCMVSGRFIEMVEALGKLKIILAF